MSPVLRSTVRNSRYPPETKLGAGAVSFETKSPLQVIGVFEWCPAWCSCCFPSAWSSVPRGAERTILPPKAKTETTAMASAGTARRIFVPILTSFRVAEDGEPHEGCCGCVGNFLFDYTPKQQYCQTRLAKFAGTAFLVYELREVVWNFRRKHWIMACVSSWYRCPLASPRRCSSSPRPVQNMKQSRSPVSRIFWNTCVLRGR